MTWPTRYQPAVPTEPEGDGGHGRNVRRRCPALVDWEVTNGKEAGNRRWFRCAPAAAGAAALRIGRRSAGAGGTKSTDAVLPMGKKRVSNISWRVVRCGHVGDLEALKVHRLSICNQHPSTPDPGDEVITTPSRRHWGRWRLSCCRLRPGVCRRGPRERHARARRRRGQDHRSHTRHDCRALLGAGGRTWTTWRLRGGTRWR